MLKKFVSYKCYAFAVLMMVFYGCTQEPTKDSTSVDLKNDSPVNTKVTELFSEVKFVPLETSTQSRLSEINEALFYNGVYVFWDAMQKSLMGFNSEGKFQFKIFPKGNGPLKLNSITDYTINIKNNSIDVYDFSQRKIVSFGFDGVPKSEKSIEFLFREFACTSKGDYVIYAPDLSNKGIRNGAFIIDSTGKFTKSFLETDVGEMYVQPVNCLSGFGDNITLVSNYSKEIFTVNNDIVKPLYNLKTGDEGFRSLILSSGSGPLLNLVYRKKPDDTKSYAVFLNSSNGKQYHLDYLINDLFLIPITIPYLFKDHNTLLVFINPEGKDQLLNILNKQMKEMSNFDKQLVSDLQGILEKINPSDNYVMIELSAKM